ncbi:universal stress protein [Cumulibacter manganitolerans]|uniref:universal stress protein n=1 Tax=Cumulibacter manganitolerans TaxID=1884992 RepID=UPI00129558A8|nr:universal stress protein [Cumulibacter manganitolerans]
MTEIPEGAVVVGVSRRSGSPSALTWAADYAARFDLPLVAVIAHNNPRIPASGSAHRPPVVATTDSEPEDLLQDRLDYFVQAALGDGHAVTTVVLSGPAVATLAAATEGARLLVLGSPRDATKSSHRVSARLLDHARCPVVVMPPLTPGLSRGRRAGRRAAQAAITAAGRSGRPGALPGSR